jgi:hypothetical protein
MTIALAIISTDFEILSSGSSGLLIFFIIFMAGKQWLSHSKNAKVRGFGGKGKGEESESPKVSGSKSPRV